MIYSYDIFDTCLCRTCGRQDIVFEQLAYTILGEQATQSAILDFISIRRRGEQAARKLISKTEIEDVSIEDIYGLCDFSTLCMNDNNEIMETEISLHRTSLIAINDTLTEISHLHESGHTIVFISDMYLHTSFLTEVLKDTGFFKDGDRVFVSCDVGLSKSTGNLYEFIKKELCIDYQQWRHKGDNKTSDYLIPKKKGIKANLFASNFSFYESMTIENEVSGAELDIFKVASIERAVRLHFTDTAEYRFASDFIAPIYVPFVYHILKDAQKHMRKLFFVARDGYILYHIAKTFQTVFPDVELYYLYASRKSLYLPGIKELTIKGVSEAIPFKGDVTIDDILSILHLSELQLDKNEFTNMSPDSIIEKLFTIPVFVESLNEEYKSQDKMAINYFNEVGMTKADSAIVDVFGTRKCQYFINNIMQRHGYPEVYGYYYEVLAERINDSSKYYALNYKEQFRFSIHDTYLTQKQQMFEQYFSITDHDRTSGYRLNEKGEAEPIFDIDLIDKSYKKRIFDANKTVCSMFALFYSQQHIINHEHCSRVAQSVFNQFFHNPKQEYLEALTGFKGSDDHYSSSLLRKRNLCSIFLSSDKYYTWMQGNAVYNSGIFYPIVKRLLSYIWKKERNRKISFP